jgi:predicted ATPase/DNA-binding CsgD family transcriptional regulator
MMHHLPFQQTPFLGRTAELNTLASLLTNSECRLLTLAGPGGIGKTRLAVEAVRRSAAHFTDDCYFVSLAPVTAPSNLLASLCSAFRLKLFESHNEKQQIHTYLSNKHLLLVLDSVEHLIPETVELITDLIHTAERLHLLVTSRVRLNVVEEWVFDVGGLDLPTSEIAISVDNSSAVQLFNQCARRVKIGFTLTDQNRSAVIRICELVGGMPLSLELAATWLNVLSCAEIAEEIQRDIGFLATTNQNVPEKHRSMRAVLDYSWGLLSEDEQRVFRWLSLCRGFDRDAAQAMGASLPMLAALVSKSIVTRAEDGRFYIHELLRQYAAERLTELPAEQAAARTLHGEYFCAFLNERATGLSTSSKPEVLRPIDRDIENIFMAWEWAVSERRYIEIQRLAPSLYRYFWHLRLYQFGIEMFSRAVAALQADAASPEQEVTLAVVLYTESRLCWRPVDFVLAASLSRRALALLRPYECPREIAHALLYVAVPSNDGPERIALMHESLALCRTIDEPLLMATVLLFLAGHEQSIGEFTNAEAYNAEALAIARQLGNHDLLYGALNFRIKRGILQRQYEAVYADALEVLRVTYSGSTWNTAGILNNLGHVTTGLGKVTEAEQYYRQSMALSLEGTFINTAMEAMWGMGCLLAKCGLVQQATELLGCVFAQIANNSLEENRHFYFVTSNFAVLQAEIPEDILAAARQNVPRDKLMTVLARLLEAALIFPSDEREREPGTEPVIPTTKRIHPLIEPLTSREAEVLGLIGAGFSNREIADRFLVGISTVKTHINNLFSKLDVRSREAAIVRARELGLLPLSNGLRG